MVTGPERENVGWRAVPDRMVIQDIRPRAPGAHHYAKAIVGEAVRVTVSMFRDGHDPIAGRAVLYADPRPETVPPPPTRDRCKADRTVATTGGEAQDSCDLIALGNDEWEAVLVPRRVGSHRIVVEGWSEHDPMSIRATGRRVLRSHDVASFTAVGRPGASPVQRLVRAVPPFIRWVQRDGRQGARGRGHGIRRPVPSAHPPDRDHRAQRPQQHPGRRARRSRQPLGHRKLRRRPHCHQPRAGDGRRLLPPARGSAGQRDGGGARLRPPVLPRSSLGDRAPSMVSPPAGRDDRLCRESAEGVPGHLPSQFLAARRRRTGGHVGGVQGDPGLLDRARRDGPSGWTTRTPSRLPFGSG